MSIAFLEGAEYDYEAKRRPSRQDLEQRIAELEAENGSLQESLDSKGQGMWEVVAMKDRALAEYEQIVAELKTQLADGHERNRQLAAEVARLQGENAQQAQTILYLTAQCQECVEQL